MQTAQKTATYRKVSGKLKPFNVRKVLDGATVVTRSRYEVTHLTWIGNSLYGEFCGRLPLTWNLDGSCPDRNKKARGLDLFIVVPDAERLARRVSLSVQKLQGSLIDRIAAFLLGGMA